MYVTYKERNKEEKKLERMCKEEMEQKLYSNE